jgi:hypothetical protein
MAEGVRQPLSEEHQIRFGELTDSPRFRQCLKEFFSRPEAGGADVLALAHQIKNKALYGCFHISAITTIQLSCTGSPSLGIVAR